MGNRLSNRINSLRYRDRNKLFANIREGELVQINREDYSINARPITRSNNNKFVYRDKLATNMSVSKRMEFNYVRIPSGEVGLYIGRHDGGAVLLIREGLYRIPVEYIKKVENDGNGS